MPTQLERSFSQPTFRAHKTAHRAVIENEYWYRNGPPFLGSGFTAKKTIKRSKLVLKILRKAARRAMRDHDGELVVAYTSLADKLRACRSHSRCGSLACPKCARAFQRAKTSAQQIIIPELQAARDGKGLVMASVIPLNRELKVGGLDRLDIPKANRWLKDALQRQGIIRVIMGSVDISWEALSSPGQPSSNAPC